MFSRIRSGALSGRRSPICAVPERQIRRISLLKRSQKVSVFSRTRSGALSRRRLPICAVSQRQIGRISFLKFKICFFLLLKNNISYVGKYRIASSNPRFESSESSEVLILDFNFRFTLYGSFRSEIFTLSTF